MNNNQNYRQTGLISANPVRAAGDPSVVGTGPAETGAEVYIKINGYNNANLMMPNQTTCVCPQGLPCPYLTAANPGGCNFGFTIVITNAMGEVKYLSSAFFPTQAYLDLTGKGIETKVNMAAKPASIDIFVHQLGFVIDAATGSLRGFNSLYHVDTFVLITKGTPPSPSNGSPNKQSSALTGQLMQTTLNVEYYTQCLSNRWGADCDLICDSNVDTVTNKVRCHSNVTGYDYSCPSPQNNLGIAFNCTICPNGYANGTCIGTQLTTDAEKGLVDFGFKIATIILGSLLGLALIIIIILIIAFFIIRNKSNSDNTRKPAGEFPKSSGYVRVNSTEPGALPNSRNKEKKPNLLTQSSAPAQRYESEWPPRSAPPKNPIISAPTHAVRNDPTNYSDDGNNSGNFSIRREAQV
uniref:LAM_G_DOMAIN domain-containing protein n=1 Tax=Rhabditophanes sp. KR3021 TaxID=114890 RepID=A0AC35U7L5_9BILA